MIFQGPLRAGRWGSRTPESHRVLQCRCQTRFLEQAAVGVEFYSSGDYRANYPSGTDEACLEVLKKTGTSLFAGKAVIDVGAGDGAFLDMVAGSCKETAAVEPSDAQRKSLKHPSFASLADFQRSGKLADVATSFNVVEHVADPVGFLREILASLRPGGELLLVTPNSNDLLLQLLPADFARYFYRTAHLFYFCAPSITLALSKAGFRDIDVAFHHRYGLDNLLHWLRAREPGKAELPLDTSPLREAYATEVERQGLASHLLVKARKEK